MPAPPTPEPTRHAGQRSRLLGAAGADLARHVLFVSDAARAERAARRLAAIRYVGEQLGVRIYTGSLGNLPVSVVYAGSGAAAVELAMVELSQLLPELVLVRVGSCASVSPEVALGDLCVVQGALRHEGTSLGYVEPGFPAMAHADAQVALVRACDERRVRFLLGLTASCAGHYGSQGRAAGAFAPLEPDSVGKLARQAVVVLDTEASCLLTMATLARLRVGVLCAVTADRLQDRAVTDEQQQQLDQLAVDVGLTALRHLARMERERGELPYWHDGLREDVLSGSKLRRT